MKILVVHNSYQHKGGEDSVVEAEIAMLSHRGHSVRLFERHNDQIGYMSRGAVAGQTLWSLDAARSFEKMLTSFQADVVHVHNTFPLISPAIYWVAARLKVPVVQTLHNFRLLCPQAMFLRDGKICEDCVGKLPWRAATKGCYRESKIQSTVLAGMVTLHRAIGTWHNKVTRYIALNEFCRSKFIAGGLPARRIVVKPNFVDYGPAISMGRSGFLFVGRLSPEKGVAVLVEAARSIGNLEVRVAGNGPEAPRVEQTTGILALGVLREDEIRNEMARATALVLPSICYENFPRTLVEAYASGLPVIASRLGVLSDLIEENVTGLLFEAGNPLDLAEKMNWARQNPERMAEMGRNARKLYETSFTVEHNYRQLMDIYNGAIDEVKFEGEQ